MENINFFASRHSSRAFEASPNPEYPGLSEKGIELAREQAEKVVDIIIKSPQKSVVALCGISEAQRTRSTARIYTETAKEMVESQGLDCVNVDINDFEHFDSITDKINNISEIGAEHPDSKIFFSWPLYIKQFMIGGDRWQNDDGTWASEYVESVFKDNNFDTDKVLNKVQEDFVAGKESAPNTEVIAEEQLDGVARLHNFLGKVFPDRNIVVGIIGHSPNLEIMARHMIEGSSDKSDVVFPEAGIMEVTFKDGAPSIVLPERSK